MLGLGLVLIIVGLGLIVGTLVVALAGPPRYGRWRPHEGHGRATVPAQGDVPWIEFLR
jgi:hypothetical protein